MQANQIEIPLSKSKVALLLLGCVVFVLCGAWLLIAPPNIRNSFWGDPVVLSIAGIASILFFGAAGVFLFKRSLDPTPGLIISDEGLHDNSSAVSVGFVPWADVLKIIETKVSDQTFINIVVKNPEEYISRQTSAFKKKLMQLNFKNYGTVVAISANGLKCDHAELKEILEKKLSRFQSREGNKG